MKIAIAICFFIALLLLALAKWQSSKETNPDDWSSAFIYIGSWLMFGVTALLTAVYALFRLFTS